MSAWVFDIETAPLPRERISRSRLERVETELCELGADATAEDFQQCVDRHLATHPATAQVTAIGCYSIDEQKGFVFLNTQDAKPSPKFGLLQDDVKFDLFTGTEKEAIEWFFGRDLERVITFNGRTFDLPFLTVRAMVNGLKLPRSLEAYRYDYGWHVDIAEVMTSHGAMRQLGLEDYCLAFGIDSPKTGKVDRKNAGETWLEAIQLASSSTKKSQARAETLVESLARYCFADVLATLLLYVHVSDSLHGVVKGF